MEFVNKSFQDTSSHAHNSASTAETTDPEDFKSNPHTGNSAFILDVIECVKATAWSWRLGLDGVAEGGDLDELLSVSRY